MEMIGLSFHCIQKEQRNGIVYGVKCDDCDSMLIGETMRTLDARMKAHKRHTAKGEILKSAITEHACMLEHAIDWKSPSVLDYMCDIQQCKITEAMHIHQHMGTSINKERCWEISEVRNASWRHNILSEIHQSSSY